MKKPIISDLPFNLPRHYRREKPCNEAACTLQHTVYVLIPVFDHKTSQSGYMKVRAGSALHKLFVDNKAACLEINGEGSADNGLEIILEKGDTR